LFKLDELLFSLRSFFDCTLFFASDKSVTTVISHDRGGEWKTLPLTEEQCNGVTLKASSSFILGER